jgi:hypothetical protein
MITLPEGFDESVLVAELFELGAYFVSASVIILAGYLVIKIYRRL